MFFSGLLFNLVLIGCSVVYPIYRETHKTSNSSYSFLRHKKRRRPLNDEALVFTTNNVEVPSNNTRYKGVVHLQNGHWGAQIYIDLRRIWLGTFKTCEEAAMAYDSASMKLRNNDLNSHRNFPLSSITVQEAEFQKSYTTEVVLNMIKDGCYRHKFRDFRRNRSQIASGINKFGTKQSNESNCIKELFQKVLTPSDVGKLNRLVIPKKYALKYLPSIRENLNEREEGVDDVEIVLYDRAMRQWSFRYCYWSSSQSFVLTRGWSTFVKKKNIKQKDVVVFYTCEVPSNVNILEGQRKSFLMIDVQCFSEDGSLVPKELKDTTKLEKNEEGVMLFGVLIR